MPPEPAARPSSPLDLFVTFTLLALQGFGGVLAVTQRELCERKRWLTHAQFVEILSIGQVLPGPNVVNVALIIGDRYFGWRGAFAALAGMMALPLVIVLALAATYVEFAQVAGGRRRAARDGGGRGRPDHRHRASARGIAARHADRRFAWSRSRRRRSWRSRCCRWPLVWVLLALGSVGMAWAWRCIAVAGSIRAMTTLTLAEALPLFGHFLVLSLLAIGGAIVVAPEMHRLMVGQMHLLDDAQFNASIAIAQAAPGTERAVRGRARLPGRRAGRRGA